jgi:hypothetical protein
MMSVEGLQILHQFFHPEFKCNFIAWEFYSAEFIGRIHSRIQWGGSPFRYKLAALPIGFDTTISSITSTSEYRF